MVQWWKLISKMYGSFLAIICLILKVLPNGNAVGFAYEHKMESFLENQAHIIEKLRLRIPSLSKEKHHCVGMFLKQSEVEHSKAMEDTTKFLENPFNAYKLVKRLVDSQLIEKITSWKLNKVKRLATIPAVSKLLHDANAAILYLAFVYKLNVTQLADGILRSNFSPPMLSTDCLELSQAAYDYGDLELAIAWGKEAFRKHSEGGSDDCFFNNIEAMLYMSLIYNILGDAEKSKYWLKKSKSEGASKSSLRDYESRIKQHSNTLKGNEARRNQSGFSQELIENPSFLTFAWDDSDLCYTARNYRPLYCQYQYGSHPFLRLARVKAEFLHREPDITMFHGVISDTENSIMLEFAENLKVIDYGVAGYQTPHHDENTLDLEHFCAIRFDTFVFYLNTVKQGGATIFPKLNFSVYPVKNSALYFTNLLPASEERNPKLKHASCPVIYGTKRIALKRLSASNTF